MPNALGGFARVALALCCTFGITACAGDVAGSADAGGRPSANSTARPTPTSTGSPTPVVPPSVESSATQGRPEARVPVSCEQLIDVESIALAVGVPAADVSANVHPLANGSAASMQAGMLECGWHGDAGTVASGLTVEVLPDAAGEYTAYINGLPLPDTQDGLIGPESRIRCYEDEVGRSCTASFLSSGYWLNFSLVQPPVDQPNSDADILAIGVATGAAMRDALDAAGQPLPQFQPPEGSLPAWESCDTIDDGGAFRSALGSASLGAPEAEESDDAIAMFAIAWQRAEFRGCSWRHSDPYSSPAGELRLLSASILPGGEWAWPELAHAALAKDGASEVDINGAESAVVSCSSYEEYAGCKVEALVDGSYLSVDTGFDESGEGSARTRAIEAMTLIVPRLS